MKKLVVSIIILFFIIDIYTIVTAKYIIEYTDVIGNIEINNNTINAVSENNNTIQTAKKQEDNEKPYIEIIKIYKTNEEKLNFRIKIKEYNIIVNKLTPNNLLIKVKDNITSPNNTIIKQIFSEDDGITYDIILTGLNLDEDISLIIKNSIIMDINNQWNDGIEIKYLAKIE